MSWTYVIDTGALLTPSGLLMSRGYAGAPGYVNDPSATAIPFKGPIPEGDYVIGAAEDRPESVGEFALPLTPLPETDTLGRGGFYMHGDSIARAGLREASDGCIVQPLFARQQVNASADKLLTVIATEAPSVV
jgi:hypothetical protein